MVDTCTSFGNDNATGVSRDTRGLSLSPSPPLLSRLRIDSADIADAGDIKSSRVDPLRKNWFETVAEVILPGGRGGASS